MAQYVVSRAIEKARHVLRVPPAPPPGRAVAVDASDRFLLSYPRSGNTWLRFLIANATVSKGAIDFATVGRFIPDIYVDTERTLRRAPRPRLLKSHEPYDPRYGRAVYVVRHPADVAVSYYHYLIKLRQVREGFDFERYLGTFVEGGVDGLGSWGSHVAGWLDARGDGDDFLLIRYEDVSSDTNGVLRRVLQHLGVEADDERVAAAVARSTADEMRRREARSVAGHRTMRHSRLDKPFVRRAVVGGAAEELSPELAERIATAWPDLMERLGYGTSPRARMPR